MFHTHDSAVGRRPLLTLSGLLRSSDLFVLLTDHPWLQLLLFLT